MVKFYKEETLLMVGNYKECGIWQIHHAASILGQPVHSIYPHIAVENLRADHNRLVLPCEQIEDPVMIMWTMSSKHSMGFNHFVPLVQKDSRKELLDLNVEDMLENAKLVQCTTPFHIDLTEDYYHQEEVIETMVLNGHNDKNKYVSACSHDMVDSSENYYYNNKKKRKTSEDGEEEENEEQK